MNAPHPCTSRPDLPPPPPLTTKWGAGRPPHHVRPGWFRRALPGCYREGWGHSSWLAGRTDSRRNFDKGPLISTFGPSQRVCSCLHRCCLRFRCEVSVAFFYNGSRACSVPWHRQALVGYCFGTWIIFGGIVLLVAFIVAFSFLKPRRDWKVLLAVDATGLISSVGCSQLKWMWHRNSRRATSQMAGSLSCPRARPSIISLARPKV